MALVLSVVQSRGMCFSERCLRSVITFEAERGYRNTLFNKMRFKNFLLSGVSKLCSPLQHKIAENILEEVCKYDAASATDRSKLLNKVSILMGYNSLHDLIESERAEKASGLSRKQVMNGFDISLACKQFPSIIVGCSAPVELYDKTSCWSRKDGLLMSELCKGFLSSSMGENWVSPGGLRETWPSLDPSLPNMNTCLFAEESSYTSVLSSQTLNLETEIKPDVQVIMEESSTVAGVEIEKSAESIELILEKSISYIPGLNKRQIRQLENCGFHTLRKMLHHFPRTYADLQNAQVGINDGQYLIFVGRILSSR